MNTYSKEDIRLHLNHVLKDSLKDETFNFKYKPNFKNKILDIIKFLNNENKVIYAKKSIENTTEYFQQNTLKNYIELSNFLSNLLLKLNDNNKEHGILDNSEDILKTEINNDYDIIFKSFLEEIRYFVFIDDAITIDSDIWKKINVISDEINIILLEYFKNDQNIDKRGVFKIVPILLNTVDEIEKFIKKPFENTEIIFLDRDLSILYPKDINKSAEIAKKIKKNKLVIFSGEPTKNDTTNSKGIKTIASQYGKDNPLPIVYIEKPDLEFLRTEYSLNSIFSLITDPMNNKIKFIIHPNGEIKIMKNLDFIGTIDSKKSLNNSWYNNDEIPYNIEKKVLLFTKDKDGNDKEVNENIIESRIKKVLEFEIILFPDNNEDEKKVFIELLKNTVYKNIKIDLLKNRYNYKGNILELYIDKNNNNFYGNITPEGINFYELILKSMFLYCKQEKSDKKLDFTAEYKNIDTSMFGLETDRDNFSNLISKITDGQFIGKFFEKAKNTNHYFQFNIGSIELSDDFPINEEESFENIIDISFKERVTQLEKEVNDLKIIIDEINKKILS